ncbi:MAG: DUF6265 family protein [Sandaracinaceae bacterium]|nr:DUF6265 family protein [Sandaracinaceae bacterium]
MRESGAAVRRARAARPSGERERRGRVMLAAMRSSTALLAMLALGCGSPQPADRSPSLPAPAAELACVEGDPPAGSPAERLSWMIGTWESEEDGAITTERWCPGEGGVLVGDNATRAGGEVVHSEALRVEGARRPARLRGEPERAGHDRVHRRRALRLRRARGELRALVRGGLREPRARLPERDHLRALPAERAPRGHDPRRRAAGLLDVPRGAVNALGPAGVPRG